MATNERTPQIKPRDFIVTAQNGLSWFVTEVRGDAVLVGCVGVKFRAADLTYVGPGRGYVGGETVSEWRAK